MLSKNGFTKNGSIVGRFVKQSSVLYHLSCFQWLMKVTLNWSCLYLFLYSPKEFNSTNPSVCCSIDLEMIELPEERPLAVVEFTVVA